MRVLKIIGMVVLAVLVLAGVGVGVFSLKPPKSRPASAEKVEATPERLARGKYLAEHVTVCIDCHSQRNVDAFTAPVIAGTEGGGGPCFDEKLGLPGRICPSNITPDPTGLAQWTDGEILRALREGVSRDGHALFPMMPYGAYRHMSDEDARAVVAYVKTLKPIARVQPPSELHFPLNLIIKTIPEPLTGPVQAPAASDHVAYGKYIFTIGGCADCHSSGDDGSAELAGGNEFKAPWGRVVASNITPDPETGIGQLTREQFIGRFKSFASMDPNTPVAPGRNTIMPWRLYGGMTEDDLGAIYDYLRTVKPVKNKVNPFPDAKEG